MAAFEGIGVAPGIAVGTIFVLDREDFAVHREEVDASKVDKEIERFESAIEGTREEILALQKNLRNGLGDEYWKIFNAHLWMLDDNEFRYAVAKRVREENCCVEYALAQEVENLAGVAEKIEDPYLRERIADIKDVSRRILHRLLGKERQTLRHLKDPTIVVSHDLMPSDTAQMDRKHVIGLATDVGGRTSHTAILARALELPAVVGLKRISFSVHTGDQIIVDGNRGVVIVNPDPATLERYEQEGKRYAKLVKNAQTMVKLPAETTDGYRVTLAANIELPEELPHAITSGAEGIGLYRTEYLFLGRRKPPTEDEQFEAYRDTVEKMKPHKVVIRTLDIGGDKLPKNMGMPEEGNPQMGWRGIRLCLEEPELFMEQLRAILRATAYGPISIMYPLISRIDELREANRLLDQAKDDLRRMNEPFNPNIDVGVMIEVPSAALIADLLAQECDFMSIGTNDLLQYSLAVDRGNERIAHLYEPSHPGVLRLIKSVIDAGKANGCWVGVCGEMASVHEYAVLLVGMGIDELSVSAVSVASIRSAIRDTSKADAEELVRKVLSCRTGTEVQDELDRMLAGSSADLRPFHWND
jgi:phosphotransferase system enzyme I (PtsI)